jgi:hypothetical protein
MPPIPIKAKRIFSLAVYVKAVFGEQIKNDVAAPAFRKWRREN